MLVTQPYLNGQPALKMETYTGQPDQIQFILSGEIQGEVAVYAEGLSIDGAVVARGESHAPLQADSPTEMTLSLDVLSEPLGECANSEWCWESPSHVRPTLHAVNGVGSKLWAVGTQGTILKSDDEGTTWTQQPSHTTETLRAIWGKRVNQEDRLWAVGNAGTVLRYQSGVWQSAFGPVEDETYRELKKHDWQGIWGDGMDAEAFWLVGDYGSVARYDHGKWTFMASSMTTQDETVGLYSVWGTSAKDVWAVGGKYSRDGDPICQNYSRVVIHWQGEGWTRVDAQGQYPLRQVAGQPGINPAVWAVGGYNDCGNKPRATVLQVGQSLQPITTPPETPSLLGVWPDSNGSVWLVGGDARTSQPAVYQRQKDATAFEPVTLPSGHLGILRSVFGTENYLITVGDFGNILRISKQGMTAQAVGVERKGGDITAMWAAGPRDVWAVGADALTNSGFVMRWDGQVWTEITTGYMAPLFGVRGSRSDRVWLVGGSGESRELWLWNGTKFLNCQLPSFVNVPLRGVWTLPSDYAQSDTDCDSMDDDLWIVGGREQGEAPQKPALFLHKRGNSWPTEPHSILKDNTWMLYSVWGSDRHHTWIAGGRIGGIWGPIVIFCNEDDCRDEAQPNFPDTWPWLFNVWGTSADNLYVVAGNITLPRANVFRRSAKGWGPADNQTPTELQADGMVGIAGTGANDIYTVGGTYVPNRILDGGMSGFIQHKTYQGWKTEAPVTTHHLRAITSAALGNVWIGGAGRTVLRRRLFVPGLSVMAGNAP